MFMRYYTILWTHVHEIVELGISPFTVHKTEGLLATECISQTDRQYFFVSVMLMYEYMKAEEKENCVKLHSACL
jgi:hypothetical protein